MEIRQSRWWAVVAAVAVVGCGSDDSGEGTDGKTPFDPSWVQVGDGKSDNTTDNTDLVGELSYGQTVATRMDAGRFHGMEFVAASDDVVSVFAAGLPRGTGAVDPVLLLYGPLEDGARAYDQPVAVHDDIRSGDRLDSHLIDVRLDRGGRYLIVVAEYNRAGGDYRVRLACTGGACMRPWFVEAAGSCTLSALGEQVLDAAQRAEQSRNTVPLEQMLTTRNQVGPAMLTGPVVFPAMADAVALAEREADIEMFVYNYSDPYDEMVDAVARLESRRIAADQNDDPAIVRIIVDSNKVVTNVGEDNAERTHTGFEPLRVDPAYARVEIATYEHVTLGVMHSKLVVIDGRTVLIGGLNIQDQHNYADPWMDSFYALEGDVGRTFQSDFDHAWAKSSAWTCGLDQEAQIDCNRVDGQAPPVHDPAVERANLDEIVPSDACIPSIALNRTAWGGLNNNVDNPMGQGFLAAMRAAQSRIRIQSPNLNDNAVKDELIDAIARGVEVQLLLSLGFNDKTESYPGQGGTNAENAAELQSTVEKDVPPEFQNLLQIRWYSADGQAPIDGNGPGASHLKYMSIDGLMVIVGSTNMDTQSWNHSREANVAIDHPGVTSQWDTQVFELLWDRSIPMESWAL